ncbi:uncharacterized protein LTR77_006811 [Saxophila tyrrhenica]|uniref:Uncharacterized protein n=1 Tax=Saxophila tyrrhenica TaxID=1690608 RepID=A0AAV9P5Z1_9PEZI|nr:hypothetical protein LTR77_006811 [Saxophila tyrrhenica]
MGGENAGTPIEDLAVLDGKRLRYDFQSLWTARPAVLNFWVGTPWVLYGWKVKMPLKSRPGGVNLTIAAEPEQDQQNGQTFRGSAEPDTRPRSASSAKC